jgi:CheY-like chemotaxis protein
VDDNGPGIAVGQEERIFEPYVSVGKESGIGVGLAAARGLAERAGGSLRLLHRIGPGACLELRIPGASGPAVYAAIPSESGVTKGSARTGTVLVADDENLQRAMFVQALQGAGFQVVACSSGTEAIEALECGTFCAAVLDHRMPGATGFSVLGRIRKLGQEFPVILVSGHEVEQQDLTDPIFRNTRIVRKPLSGDVLLNILLSMLEAAP